MTDFQGVDVQKRAIRGHRLEPSIRPKKQTPVAPLLTALGPVIYAMRTRDGYIKIGHTGNLANRRQHFGGFKDILAWRNGTIEDEQAIHAELSGLAIKGREYYSLADRHVLAIVNAWREDLGQAPMEEHHA